MTISINSLSLDTVNNNLEEFNMKMQITEITALSMITPFIIMICLFEFNLLTPNLFLIFISLIGIGTLFPFIILIYAKKRYSKDTFYNPITGIVELHIGRNLPLQKSYRQAVRLGKKMEKNVVFYTNHYPEERLQAKGARKMIIKKANFFQSYLFNLTFYIITIGKETGNEYPVLKCEILYDKFRAL